MAPSLSLHHGLLVLLTALLHLTVAQDREPASASAQVGGGLAFAVNVPSNSSDSLFINYRIAAGRTTWGAFGFGSQMSGALMFIAYMNEAGDGVTVSPRIATGQTMPQHADNIRFIDMGSELANDSFIVKGMCENCRSWDGGSIDTSAEEQPMVWGSGPAGTLESDDVNARISVHQSKGRFGIDMRSASGEPGLPQFQLSNTTSGDSDDSDLPRGSGAASFFDKSPLIIAHAILMVGTFLILFPLGYVVLRLLDKVLIHAAVQSFASLVVVIASALGIAASKNQGISPQLTAPHQITGFMILVHVFVTLGLGAAGHAIYRKTGKPAKFMIGHRILGPVTVIMGLVNCVLGFRFAGHYRPIIGFIILSILIFTGIAALVLLKRRRAMRSQAMHTPAAMNFREGGYGNAGGARQAPPAYGASLPGHGPAIPLQTYQQQPKYN